MQFNTPIYYFPVVREDQSLKKASFILAIITFVFQVFLFSLDIIVIGLFIGLGQFRMFFFILIYLSAFVSKYMSLVMTIMLYYKKVADTQFYQWTFIATSVVNGIAALITIYESIIHIKNGFIFIIHISVIGFFLLFSTNFTSLLYLQSMTKDYFNMRRNYQSYYYPDTLRSIT